MPPINAKLQRRQRSLLTGLPPQRVDDGPPIPRATRRECEELYAFLKSRNAVGWKHGILRAEVRIGLSRMVNRFVADRKLQAIMAAAPTYGVPLASNSSSGYFIIGTVEDADTCIEELESRIAEHRLRLKALDAIRGRIKHGKADDDASAAARGVQADDGVLGEAAPRAEALTGGAEGEREASHRRGE